MVRISFPFRVKYEGHFYAPLKTFEVKDDDVSKLTAIGAKVVEALPDSTKLAPNKGPTKSKPYKIPAPTKKEK